MSQNNTLLNEIWNTLSNALNQIFELRYMSRTDYMTHYKFVK